MAFNTNVFGGVDYYTSRKLFVCVCVYTAYAQ